MAKIIWILILSLMLSSISCSIPLKVTFVEEDKSNLLAKAIMFEPFGPEYLYGGGSVPKETAQALSEGHTYETLEELRIYLKKFYVSKAVDDWIDRVKARYEKMEGR
jgi:hypothetical protein